MQTETRDYRVLVLVGIFLTVLGCVVALYQYKRTNYATAYFALACTACTWLVTALLNKVAHTNT